MAAPIALPSGLRLGTVHTCRSDRVLSVATMQISPEKATFNWSSTPPDVELPQPQHTPTDASFLTANRPSRQPAQFDFQYSIDSQLDAKQRQELQQFLTSNSDLFASDSSAPETMRHVPPITIDTGSTPPIRCVPFRSHPFAHRYIGEKVRQILKQGLIEESSSNWSFPVVLASKPNGKIRFCMDYRR